MIPFASNLALVIGFLRVDPEYDQLETIQGNLVVTLKIGEREIKGDGSAQSAQTPDQKSKFENLDDFGNQISDRSNTEEMVSNMGGMARNSVNTISTMEKYHQSLKVHVDLLDISKNVEADADAKKMIEVVKHDILASSCEARTFLRRQRPSREEVSLVQKQVFRFIQPKDKYTALSSMLLKSRALHVSYQSSEEERVTVTDLPRTKYKKPYIPILDYDVNKMSKSEEDMHPLSISHQFPFVGLAKLDTSSFDNVEPRPHVGMDIVAFDAHNPKLYSDEREFINVFQSSFTASEWSLIENQQSYRLNEFYVRWAMKEAYTKALGMGMGVDFSSFEMKLNLPNQESQDSCLWSYILSQAEGCSIPGSICHLSTKKTEPWQFFFLPLHQYAEDETQRQLSDAKGCMCICVGPFPGDCNSWDPFQISIHWTDLQSLVCWHQPDSKALP